MPTLNEYLAGVRASADLPDTSGWSDYNTPGAWTSVKRGFGSGVGAVGSMLRDVAPGVGGAVEEWGQNVAKFNPRQYTTSADVLASPFSAAAEQIPETLGQVLPAALALLVTKNPLAAGAVMGGTSYAQNVGETRARQRELGQDTPDDALRAYAYGVPQAGLDVLFGPEAALMKMFSKSVGKGMTEAGARELAERGLLKTVGVEGAKAAAFEAPTEIGQSVLGRLATRESLTDASAAEEYFMSGFAGLAGGGGMGAVTGPMTRANASKLVDQIDQARSVLDQPITNAQDMVLARQAGQFLESVAGNDFGLKAAEEMSRQHVAQLNDANLAILSDIADKEYAAGLAADRANQQAVLDAAQKELMQRIDEQIRQTPSDIEQAAETEAADALAQLEAAGRQRTIAQSGFIQPYMEAEPLSGGMNPYNLAGTVGRADEPFALVNPPPYAFDAMAGAVQPYEAQFDARNVNDFISLGQQLGVSHENAQAQNDQQVMAHLQQLADNLIYQRMFEGFGTQPVNQMVAGREGQPPVPGVQGELFGPRGGVSPGAKAPKQSKADKRAAEAQAVWAQAQESGLTPDQLVVVKAGVDDLSIPVKELKDRVDQFKMENANAEPKQDTQSVETPPSETAEGQATKGETTEGQAAQGEARQVRVEEGATDAVQEPSTAPVDVQPEARDGEAVGEGDAKGQEVAEEVEIPPSRLKRVKNVVTTDETGAETTHKTAYAAVKALDKRIADYTALLDAIRKC